ncbi:hypothetical protein WME91_09375 [Sorangium sp. So ce269]
MNITIGAIATFLPEPSYTTDCLLDASGGKLSPALQAMLRRLGGRAAPFNPGQLSAGPV